MGADDVLTFWFDELTPKQWFAKSVALDDRIRRDFGALHRQAAQCECFAWRATARGRLAEVLVLDQFSRNLFRDSAQAFACDALALALAQEAVAQRFDRALQAHEKAFLYMPYMHSESAAIHREAHRLFAQPGLEYNLEFERRHSAVIERFGRYPHRNALLGRDSSADELAFLQQPGSSF